MTSFGKIFVLGPQLQQQTEKSKRFPLAVHEHIDPGQAAPDKVMNVDMPVPVVVPHIGNGFDPSPESFLQVKIRPGQRTFHPIVTPLLLICKRQVLQGTCREWVHNLEQIAVVGMNRFMDGLGRPSDNAIFVNSI
ncbi:hypothetical protein AVEN_71118-1 [Araneus ventricosus]|uniref:Uncharacterized protein n=1 Tax=Araneus ventricosus TaxID=182803 RepID=A0A4Y2HJL3_ARAVE|nr:hypothetical protein AVEN_71118-1 [Araneus ventricosus]